MNIKYNFSAISGSLRNKSYNAIVLKAAQILSPEYISFDLLSITYIPLYNFDLRVNFYPESVEKLCKSIEGADALIIITPEYNYSISGALKKTIDFLFKHLEKPIAKKTEGIMSASLSLQGGVSAQYHLMQILVAVNTMTIIMSEVVIRQVNTKFNEADNLIDEKTQEFLKTFIEASAVNSSILKNDRALYY